MIVNIILVYGQVLEFSVLSPNTIALDGAVQGPQMDPTARRFSFDHHAGCVRLVTLATCQQVATALRLGLVIDEETRIVINDLDADTSLAVWLLQNPERVDEPAVKELVERVGLTDAHGPIFKPCPLHPFLAPKWGSKDPQTLEMLDGFLRLITAYADGKWKEPAARPSKPSKGFGWSPKTGWAPVEVMDGFDDVYRKGFLAGFIWVEASSGTRMYTVAKRSDLVPLSLGPGAVKRPPDSDADYRMDTILGRLALAEITANPAQTHATNWGGASSIGGGPRNPDGGKSRLEPEQVLAIFREFTD